MAVATSMASSGPGIRPDRTTVSITLVNASANGALAGCSLSSESVSRWNWSDRCLILLASPPDSADQISLDAAIRLRACASNTGSKRPYWGVW